MSKLIFSKKNGDWKLFLIYCNHLHSKMAFPYQLEPLGVRIPHPHSSVVERMRTTDKPPAFPGKSWLARCYNSPMIHRGPETNSHRA